MIIIHKKGKRHKHFLWKWWFDTAFTYGAFFGPLVTLPQIIEIWWYHNASGVSIYSWSGYTCGAGIWLLYGIIHKERAVVNAYTLAFPFALSIVIGIIIFK